MPPQLSDALEDYLEAILHLEQRKRFARVRDISEALSVAKSAVTAALRSLSDMALVNYEPYEPVTLTAEGMEKARAIALRHRIIKDFLVNVLGLDVDGADSIACGMEHGVDREALRRFVCFLAFIGQRAEGGRSWLDEFQRFISEGAEGQTCDECIQQYLGRMGTDETGGTV